MSKPARDWVREAREAFAEERVSLNETSIELLLCAVEVLADAREREGMPDDGAGLQERLTRQIEANTAHLATIATLEKQLSEEREERHRALNVVENLRTQMRLVRESLPGAPMQDTLYSVVRESLRTTTADALRLAAKECEIEAFKWSDRRPAHSCHDRILALIPAGSAAEVPPPVSADAIAAAEARGFERARERAIPLCGPLKDEAWGYVWQEAGSRIAKRIRAMKDTLPPSAPSVEPVPMVRCGALDSEHFGPHRRTDACVAPTIDATQPLGTCRYSYSAHPSVRERHEAPHPEFKGLFVLCDDWTPIPSGGSK